MEAEGIYVGYKYYETRYYDSIVNPDSGADSSAGATQSDAWDYNEEVLYDFGHGLSYLDYTQSLKSVDVDCSEDGEITAVVEITNNSDQDGRFLAQLYVQQPYTDYDRENLVEKSAVMFLNSAKTDVAAGETEEVTITVPTKYLASYDYTNAKTYILDDGDYIFTAAAGAHEAINNILAEQGYTEDDGMDADGTGDVQTWNLDELDNTTFAVSNDTEITNVADSADLNYWTEEDTVTYLTRQDWEGTWPVNYNEVEINIGDSPKSEEWIAELRGETYTIQDGDAAAEAVDNGVRFHTDYIQQDQMDNVENEFWTDLTDQISIDEAVGGVIHGGSQSDMLTDLRCFQGGLEDADGMAVMIAFNRIGATNASHYAGMLQNILRGEWGYTGLISTDMMNNNYYFNPESMIMAGITQVADFATNDNHINMGVGGNDATWAYISEETVANDAALVDQARENLKYQLYTFANSAVMNVSTERVQTWWDTAISTVTYASGVLAQMKLTGMAAAAVEIVSGILRIAATVLLTLCLVTLITARVEGLGFIYFSNADVLQEVQTPANMSSAAGTIANMICLGAATVFSMIAAFFNLRKKETQN